MRPLPNRESGFAASSAGPVFIIALAQLFGTSLWFSANSAGADLMHSWNISAADLGLLTGAVQLGFILGTLFLSLSGLADRFAASRIFAICAILGALFNGAFAWLASGVVSGAALRFLVGIVLAGIYPLGMKLVVSWNPQRASTSLALLVGMLTLGTALPHALRSLGGHWAWQYIVSASSVLALGAAAMIFFLGDGPGPLLSIPRPQAALKMSNALAALGSPDFRYAFLGYLGHMWELYAFWTIVPMLILQTGLASAGSASAAALSFSVIAAGALGCLIGGALSRKHGSAKVAATALAVSGLCCLCFPWAARQEEHTLLLAFMLLWGLAVVADSPQFSAIVANSCPPQAVGSALALQNSAGFAITVASIATATSLIDVLGNNISWVLLPGPIFGLVGMIPLLGKRKAG